MRLIFTVQKEEDGMLLRDFLRECSLSSELSRAIKFNSNGYFADGEPILANRRVFAGQKISFELPPEKTSGATPESQIPIDIVWEDDFIMVVNKPAGIAVHPTLNYGSGTLANGYAAYRIEKGESPVFRAVNRIDKDTSGLVLLAKNAYIAPILAKNVEKKYVAIVEGEMPLGLGAIDAPLGRKGDSIIGRCVTPLGKESRTEYEILKSDGTHSLALCTPVTGRTHQIRVHFSHIGHSLAGDDLYGGTRNIIQRQALHCKEIQLYTVCGEKVGDDFYFDVERKTQKISVMCEMPKDMLCIME